MDKEHPIDLLPLLLLGMLDPEEARQVRTHLSGCTICQREFEACRQNMLELAPDDPQLAPGANVKQKLMARVHTPIHAPARQTPLQRLSVTFALTGIIAVFMLAIFFLYSINQPNSTVMPLVNPTPVTVLPAATARSPVAQSTTVLVATVVPTVPVEMDAVDQFANTAGTAAHSITTILAAPEAQAVLYTHQGDPRVGFVADQLPPAPHGHTYQLWVAAGDTQVSLGTFDSHNGHVKMIGSAPAPIDSYTAAMVTIEPVGGSATPGTKVLWQIEL
jgi:anti-sigma-K factor RskA